MYSRVFILFFSLTILVIFASCNKKSTEPTADNTDIPQDPVGLSIPALAHNNIVPSAIFTRTSGNTSRIQVNLLGLVDPSTLNPIDLHADYENGNYNFYLEENGTFKGVKLTKVSSNTVLKADIVFTIDNSGSMDQEADTIAARIVDFANYLSQKGLDAQFACVGYDGWVNGGLNLSNASTLQKYLNRAGYTGTYRTYGFSGADSAALETDAWNDYSSVYGENGVVAVLFADAQYKWRAGAQRVFVNFTDEPTQPGGAVNWSTEYMCEEILGKATVHTVFSEDSTYYTGYWQDLYNERPWDMSKCTGGTVKFISYDATDLNLLDLPVAGALSNSYLVEYVTSSSSSKNHVVIAVVTNTADGKIEYFDLAY